MRVSSNGRLGGMWLLTNVNEKTRQLIMNMIGEIQNDGTIQIIQCIGPQFALGSAVWIHEL